MKQRKVLSLILVLVMLISMIPGAVFAESTYTVSSGDVLWRIAERYQTTWEILANYNKLENPDLIFPGQEIKIPDEDMVEVSLLATSDLHGRIYAYEYAIDSPDADAGLAKAATIIKEVRANKDHVVLMDLGDTVQDNSAELFNNQPVHPMIEGLNALNYDTWTIGNHEFNFELSFLEKNIAAFNNTVLAANIYKDNGERFVEPYTIIEKGGVRIAVVGLMPPHVPVWEAAAPSHFEGLSFTSTVDEAKKVVAELEGKYDVLVGAFHLGKYGEHGYEGAADVAMAVPEFDVIFMGHAHSRIAEEEVNGVKLVEPGSYGWAVSQADITLVKEDGQWMVSSVMTKNNETYDVAEDPEILAQFAYVHEASLADANTVVGTVTADYVEGVDYITGEASVTTMPTTQIIDTALIDLINDVQLFYTGAQVSSAAAFKNDMNLVAGDFKKKDVANIYKYPNTLMGVRITGENLKEYMEWSASYYNTYEPGDLTISFDENIRGYNYDMFAGVTYDIDLSKPAGERITNLLLDGEPIDDDMIYTLAVNNYRFGTLMSLGLVTEDDKYYDSYTEMQDAGRIRDLIIKYIQEEKDGLATPEVDNNWRIINADLDHPLKDMVYDMIKSGELTIPRSEDGRTPNVEAINIFDLLEQGYFSDYTPITLLHTNDMHGFFIEGRYDGMGAALMATKIKSVRANNPNTLLLDAGDATQGNNLVTLSDGVNGFRVLNALGYDAMTVGNHEFDYGKDQLVSNIALADFPVLGANVQVEADNSDFLPAYTIKELDGVKVGIFGLATPETKYKSHPDNSVGLAFNDPIEEAKAIIAELGPQVDVVVALVHLGIEGDMTSEMLAEEVDGIDVIIDGHSHSTLPDGLMINGTLLVQAGEKTKNLGIVELLVKDGQVVDKDAMHFTKAMSATVSEDPAVLALINELQAANAIIENEVVATAPFTLDGEREDVRTGETNLGNLITAAMMDVSGADVALMNGGGIRTSIAAGEVTKGDILTVLPFGNTVTVVEVSGADLIAIMENGLDTYPEAKGAFPHIAGMTVKFDSSQPAGSRVTELKVNGTLVDEGATYTLVTNDFLKAGGDGYSMLADKDAIAEYAALDEVLIDYVQENGFDAAATDGRIEDIAPDNQASISYQRLAA